MDTKGIYYYDDCYDGDVCDILGIPAGRYYHDEVEVENVTWFFISINKLTKQEMIDIVNDES